MVNRNISLALLALTSIPAMADVTIRGTVTDANSHQGLAGVYVQAFSGSKGSTLTDAEGNYEITVPDYCTSLRIRRDGYQTQQVAISGRESGVDAQLYPSSFSGLVGLEQTSIQSLTADISTLSADISLDRQIAAQLGGQIRSVSRGGVPGVGNMMLLGGINSLSANAQPLVVIDGVIIDMQYSREALHQGAYNNLLADLSVQDIESVQVLRNGAAIYGAKGANGVILINTRRCHSFNTRIDFSASATYEQAPRLPEMMDAGQYRTYVSEMLGTTGTKLDEFKFLREDPNYYYYQIYHNETDWSKQVYDNASGMSYNLNVQGGDDVANYNLSVGYTSRDATLIDNNFSRFNMRINSDVKLTNRVKVRLDASYSDINRDLRDDGVADQQTVVTGNQSERVFVGGTITSPGFLALIKSPFLSPYAYDTQGNISSFYSGADDYLDEVLGSEASLANPASILYYGEAKNKNKFDNRMVTLGIIPTADLGHGLTLRDAFSFMMFNADENYYLPVNGVPRYEVKGTGTVQNRVASSSSHQYLTTNDLSLSWKYQQEGHALDLMGGWRFNLSRYQLNGMNGYNSGNDKMPNMSTGLSYRTTTGLNEKVTTLTYYAAADYNYMGRYYANASLSAEASSRFGADIDALKLFGVRWGFFPSVSGSWVISNEQWFNQLPAINYLRLNVGYDMTGNDDIDLNASKTYFKAVRLLNVVGGSVAGNVGNTDLKWETTHRLSYGLDMNLANNRLSLSVNAFKSWTQDLLTLQQLPYVTGISQNWRNGGKLENNGVSINTLAKVVNARDWQWQLGLSIGHYRNKITELASGDFETTAYTGTILTKVGLPAGVFYGYQTDGVYSTTAEAQEAGQYITDLTGAKSYFQAGDMRFVDQNGDQEINESDRVIIGNPNPDVYGNISSHLQWKRLSFDATFNYSLGNDVFNYQRSVLEGGSRFFNQTTALCGRWSSEGQHTDIPRVSYEDPMGNARFSDRWIEDGSYLRLADVTLSYKWDFDYRFLQGVTLWGSANNLFTLTKYLGSDPECSVNNNVLYQGIDCGILPASRSFSLGVLINL